MFLNFYLFYLLVGTIQGGLTTKTISDVAGHDLSGHASLSLNLSHDKSDEDLETGADISPALKYFGSENQASEESHKMSKTAWLDKFCAQNIGSANNALHPLEKYWLLWLDSMAHVANFWDRQ